MSDYGYTPAVIKDDHFVLGRLSTLPSTIIQENGQWGWFLPRYEPQFNAKYDTAGCTVWGHQNAIEILLKKITGRDYNFSERFTYILANITPPGADVHFVAECIRKNGLLDDALLPMTPSFEEFLTPKPMTQDLLNQAKKWGFVLGHEWLWIGPQTKEQRIEKMKWGLLRSPLGISVVAWFLENGVYVDKGLPNSHWCVCFGWNDKGWLVFDSYDQSIKTLSYDHNIQECKRYSLEPKIIAKNWLIDIINELKSFILDLAKKPVGGYN